jgi:hypothetical protein
LFVRMDTHDEPEGREYDKWVSRGRYTDVARFEDDTRVSVGLALISGLFVAIICETLGIRDVP